MSKAKECLIAYAIYEQTEDEIEQLEAKSDMFQTLNSELHDFLTEEEKEQYSKLLDQYAEFRKTNSAGDWLTKINAEEKENK